MGLSRAVLTPVLVLALLTPELAAQTSAQSRVRLVRVGYVTLDPSDPTPETSSSFATVRQHLMNIAELAGDGRADTPPLDFALTVGNDYQIVSWLREGAIDGAILSPFGAALLQQEGVVVPVMELVGLDRSDGRRPVFAAAIGGRPVNQPFDVLDAYLSRLLQEIQGEGEPGVAEIREGYGVLMTTHLSTSGFIAPLLFIDLWLQRELRTDRPETRGAIEEAFWRLLFETVRFTLGSEGALSLPDSVVVFSDLGHRTESLDSLRARVGGLGQWVAYPIDVPTHESPSSLRLPAGEGRSVEELRRDRTTTGAAFRIPNDVFVIRSDVACLLVPTAGVDARSPAECAGTAANTWLLEGVRRQAAALGPRGGYRTAQRFKAGHHALFAHRVAEVMGPDARVPYLADQFEHWYVDGHFEFRLEEVMNFLRQGRQHANRGRLALVLPGGGVKSVYQAGLLQALYTGCHLVNGTPGDPTRCDVPVDSAAPARSVQVAREAPLRVESIIGTSGGAMVGFLTALHGPGGDVRLEGSVAETAQQGVFRAFDLLRWISVLVLLLLLLLFLLPLEPGRDEPASGDVGRPRSDAAGRRLSIVYRLASAWPLIVFPLLVRLTGPGDVETVRGWEGGLYGATVILVHLVLTCFRGSDPSEAPAVRGPRSILIRTQAAGLVYLGAFMIVIALVGHFAVPDPFLRHGLPLSVLATGGVVCLYLGQIFQVWAGREKVHLVGVEDWARGILSAAGAVCAAFGLMLVARWLEYAPLLELTGEYWVALLAAAGATFSVLLLWLTRPQRGGSLGTWGSWLRRRFLWLSESDGAGSWLNTPGSRLLALGGMGGILWAGVVVPGVYGNRSAMDQFERTARTTRDEVSPMGRLHANLIVTGSLLRDEVIPGSGRVVRQGDVYFCFSGPTGCPSDEGPRWHVSAQPDWDMMVDAVFASGSPFPVLPAHRARLPDGTEVSLVDGAFTHNVPYEAALLSGANQVLAIRSSPVELGGEPPAWQLAARRAPSRLTQGLGRVFGFLFARAQELDRSQARGMLVASLAPDPSSGRFPALTSFTEETVAWLQKRVREDLEEDRRIGRIESWGEPVILELIHGS